MTGPAARAALATIAFYRTALSPLRGPSCRYVPSCSAYGAEAIETYGAVRGGWLALRRVSRCHPLHKGGYDPVPGRESRGGVPDRHSGASYRSAPPPASGTRRFAAEVSAAASAGTGPRRAELE